MPPPTINVPTRSAIACRKLPWLSLTEEEGSRMFSFEGKKTLVTGGGRGIGRAIAIAFAQQGADVAIAARGREELEHVAGEIRALGRNASVHVVDMGDTPKAVEMVDAAAKALGGLDVLVNNAGGITELPGSIGPLAETTLDAFDAMYALNVRSRSEERRVGKECRSR